MAENVFEVIFQTTAQTGGAEKMATAIAGVATATKKVDKAPIAALADEFDNVAERMEEAFARSGDFERGLKQLQSEARATAQELRNIDLSQRAGANQSQSSAAMEERHRVFGKDTGSGGGDEGGTAALGGMAAAATRMVAPVAAAYASWATLKAVVGGSLAEFAESEQAALALGNALEKTGQNTGGAQRGIEAQATALQKLTNINDETWQGAATRLVEYGAKVHELPGLLETVKGVAGRMGGDVGQATDVVAKSIAGTTRGLSQLGVHLDENATRTEIMAALAEAAATGQGKLEARTKGLSGAFGGFKASVGDVGERFGGLIAKLSGVEAHMRTATKVVDFFKTGGVEPAKRAVRDLSVEQEELAKATAHAAAMAARHQRDLETEAAKARALTGDVQALTAAWEAEQKAKDGKANERDERGKARLDLSLAEIERARKAGQIDDTQATVAKENVTARAEFDSFKRAQDARTDAVKNATDEQTRLLQEAARAKGVNPEAAALATQEAAARGKRIEALNDEIKQEEILFAARQQTRREGVLGDLEGANAAKEKKAAEDAAAAAGKQAAGEAKKDAKEVADAKRDAARAVPAEGAEGDGRRRSEGRNDDRRRSRRGATRSEDQDNESSRSRRRSRDLFRENSVVPDGPLPEAAQNHEAAATSMNSGAGQLTAAAGELTGASQQLTGASQQITPGAQAIANAGNVLAGAAPQIVSACNAILAAFTRLESRMSNYRK